MGRIEEINEKIKGKLIEYGLTSFDELDDKTQKRLYEIELCVSKMEANSRELERRLKDTQPNITRIISSENVSITKKTAYNNHILIEYMDMSIKNFPDFFNENKVKKLEQNYMELNDMYSKVINNIIDNYNVEYEKTLLLEEIKRLNKQIDNLKEIISEKNKEISNIKRNNKVIILDKDTKGK